MAAAQALREPAADARAVPAAAASADPDDLSELRKTHPAASNSDSPATGEPRRTTGSGLPIDGGWTGAASMQYFALNGDELRVIAQGLLADLSQRLTNDLRFSMALTYPRIAVRVVLEVEAFANDDQSFAIEKILPTASDPATKTPREIARLVADEVCFVLIAERTEVDQDGQSITPPDQLRDEFALDRPRKQQIGTGINKQFVDVR
jgi:hypothetical protein